MSRAREAGAAFLVSPGTTPPLLAALQASGLPVLPGAATASEVLALHAAGIRHVKLFPAAAAGGVGLLRALAGPFGDVRFCPTGGIGAADAATYLALPNVSCVGGSWMLDPAAIAAGDWAAVRDRAARAVGACAYAAPRA